MNWKVGDVVVTYYFGVAQYGVVVKDERTRVRVRFHNQGGDVREHWTKRWQVRRTDQSPTQEAAFRENNPELWEGLPK
jgi:hypothetical protein